MKCFLGNVGKDMSTVGEQFEELRDFETLLEAAEESAREGDDLNYLKALRQEYGQNGGDTQCTEETIVRLLGLVG